MSAEQSHEIGFRKTTTYEMLSVIAATKGGQNVTDSTSTSKLEGQYIEEPVSPFNVDGNLIPVSTFDTFSEAASTFSGEFIPTLSQLEGDTISSYKHKKKFIGPPNSKMSFIDEYKTELDIVSSSKLPIDFKVGTKVEKNSNAQSNVDVDLAATPNLESIIFTEAISKIEPDFIVSSKEGNSIEISEIADRTIYKEENGVGVSGIEPDVISPYKVKSDIITQSIINGNTIGVSGINVEDMTIGYDHIGLQSSLSYLLKDAHLINVGDVSEEETTSDTHEDNNMSNLIGYKFGNNSVEDIYKSHPDETRLYHATVIPHSLSTTENTRQPLLVSTEVISDSQQRYPGVEFDIVPTRNYDDSSHNVSSFHMFSSVLEPLPLNTHGFTFTRTDDNRINIENPGMTSLSSSSMSISSLHLSSSSYNISDLTSTNISLSMEDNMALVSDTVQDSGNVLSLTSEEATHITPTGVLGGEISASIITVTAIDENTKLVYNSTQDSGNVLSLPSKATNIILTGVVGGDISESVISVTTLDKNIALVSHTVQVSGNVLPLPVKSKKITSVSILGGNISESAVNITTIDENKALAYNTLHVSGNVLPLSLESANITPTGVVEGNTSESRISFTAIDENMTLASSNRAEIIGNALPLSLEAANITSTGVVGVNISESVISVTAVDENMPLVSDTVQISGSVLSFSSEDANITSTGVVGVNISESVISVTAVDENMSLVSDTVHISGSVLSLSSEAINITSTGVVEVNISESVVNFTAIDEHMALVTNTIQISGNVLPLSSEVINITSTGVAGVDISESAVSVTAINKNMALVSNTVLSLSLEAANIIPTVVPTRNISKSVVNVTTLDENKTLAYNTVQISGNVLSLPSEATNITPTSVLRGNILESVVTVTAIDENMAFVSSDRAVYNGNDLSLSLEDTISTSVIGEDISESNILAVPSIYENNNKLVGKNIRTVPSNVNIMTLLDTKYVTGNIQDFHVSGESIRDLDIKRHDDESWDVSIFSDNIVAASLIYRNSMFITELQTPILQPSSVWQHPRGDIHFKTGITEPYSLGMYFVLSIFELCATATYGY